MRKKEEDGSYEDLFYDDDNAWSARTRVLVAAGMIIFSVSLVIFTIYKLATWR